MPSLSQCWFTATRSNGKRARLQIVSNPWQQVKYGACLMDPSVFSKQLPVTVSTAFSLQELVEHNFLSPGFLRRKAVYNMVLTTEESWTVMLGHLPCSGTLARKERPEDSFGEHLPLLGILHMSYCWYLVASQWRKYNYSNMGTLVQLGWHSSPV